jgi:NAD(P) transhydrogenase subunit beta
MSTTLYYTLSVLCVFSIIWGIKLMNSPKSAIRGNLLGAVSLLITVILTLYKNLVLDNSLLWFGIILGGILGYFLALKVTMLKMPQMIALLNGLGGGASGLVAIMILTENQSTVDLFSRGAAALTMLVGWTTFSGSLIAAAKLAQKLSQKPVRLKRHSLILAISSVFICIIILALLIKSSGSLLILTLLMLLASLFWGIIFTIRVGGADMPITISLLNSLSGLAGAITGFAIYDPLLISVGGIVGAAGLILTQVMCKAMNRSLLSVLTGKTTVPSTSAPAPEKACSFNQEVTYEGEIIINKEDEATRIIRIIEEARSVVIVPGYGMALAQAQYQVKELYERLMEKGKDVKFAIHPVAGRMPGHMNVLLAEVDIPYDKLYELEAINDEFSNTDLVIVVGANDVINPAANDPRCLNSAGE